MKASKEIRRIFNRLRRRWSRGNGVIPGALLDMPGLDAKFANSKGRYRRWKAQRSEMRTGGNA